MVAKYKERFISQTKRAQGLMEDINRLRKRFPDSIFIISGDHGPYLSQDRGRRQTLHSAGPACYRFVAVERDKLVSVVGELAGKAEILDTRSNAGFLLSHVTARVENSRNISKTMKNLYALVNLWIIE